METSIAFSPADASAPYQMERLAAATSEFWFRFIGTPGARELLEKKKAELRERGIRLN